MAVSVRATNLPKVIYGGNQAIFIAKTQEKTVQIHAASLKITTKVERKSVYTVGPLPSATTTGKMDIDIEFSDMLIHETPFQRLAEQLADDFDLTISVWAYSPKQATFLEVIRFYGCVATEAGSEIKINEMGKANWKLSVTRGFDLLNPQLIEESPAFQI